MARPSIRLAKPRVGHAPLAPALAEHAQLAVFDAGFVDECMECLNRLNPAIGPGDLITAQVGRLRNVEYLFVATESRLTLPAPQAA